MYLYAIALHIHNHATYLRHCSKHTHITPVYATTLHISHLSTPLLHTHKHLTCLHHFSTHTYHMSSVYATAPHTHTSHLSTTLLSPHTHLFCLRHCSTHTSHQSTPLLHTHITPVYAAALHDHIKPVFATAPHTHPTVSTIFFNSSNFPSNLNFYINISCGELEEQEIGVNN